MTERRYTLADLCDLTGLSEGIIRYYRKRGLLPPALDDRTHGQEYVWTGEHLACLRYIQERSTLRVTLEEMRQEIAEGLHHERRPTHNARATIPELLDSLLWAGFHVNLYPVDDTAFSCVVNSPSRIVAGSDIRIYTATGRTLGEAIEAAHDQAIGTPP